MKSRKLAAHRKLNSKASRKHRKRILFIASQDPTAQLDANAIVTDAMQLDNIHDHDDNHRLAANHRFRSPVVHEPSPFSSAPTRSNTVATAARDVVMESSDPMDCSENDLTGSVMAAAKRTKPVNSNKYKKRLGAKQAKKLEMADDASGNLSPQDATMYRALSARCNYLSQDRPDISYASKELCREFAIPTVNSFKKLKRLARYLAGSPRMVYKFKWQTMPLALDCYVDTDFAGCKETRRSTSGGTIMIGSCLVKHWSKTQTTISLSSGEAELHGIAHGAAQALGIRSLMKDMGWNIAINLHSDATAAIGIARRKGLGKIRHLDCTDLWIQDKVRSKDINIFKVLGTDNMADALTKYVDRATPLSSLDKMGLVPMTGRPECEPKAMGA